jgi:hypothetical protein
MAICKRGTIRRAPYTRRAYTRKSGTQVREAYVPASCITNRGATGKWTMTHKESGIGRLKAGRLKEFGYSSSKTEHARHIALGRAMAAYGALAVYRMLNAVYVYSKRTSPSKSALYKMDRDYVGKLAGYKH